MSYKITLRDKSEIILPDEAGRALKDHLLSLKKPANIEIGGDMYNSSQIVSVAKANLSAGTNGGQPQIAGPKYSCGSFSIQMMIHKIALRDKANWSKLVKDKDWRERTRLAIRAKYPDRKFCDHIANEHACLEVATK